MLTRSADGSGHTRCRQPTPETLEAPHDSGPGKHQVVGRADSKLTNGQTFSLPSALVAMDD
ncbi:MAG: hypothetical protein H6965_00380 [Chromatiaceae bacterium]|nr:hypothetical protein [Chromatiaceae bacterium]